MQILRYSATARKCGVSRMTLWRWATQREYVDMGFPKPIPLGANSVGFIEEEIENWLTEQTAKRDADGDAASGEKGQDAPAPTEAEPRPATA